MKKSLKNLIEWTICSVFFITIGVATVLLLILHVIASTLELPRRLNAKTSDPKLLKENERTDYYQRYL